MFSFTGAVELASQKTPLVDIIQLASLTGRFGLKSCALPNVRRRWQQEVARYVERGAHISRMRSTPRITAIKAGFTDRRAPAR